MSGKGAKGLSGKGAKGAKGTMGDKKKPISRSLKAGLQFPVGRIHRFLKGRRRATEQNAAAPSPACSPASLPASRGPGRPRRRHAPG